MKHSLFYGWHVVVINMLALASGTGLVNNSAGQFLKPLTEALHIGRSEASMYNACITVAMLLLVPQLSRLLKIARPRTLSTLGTLCVAGGWFSLSFAQNRWHLYACAAVIGVGLSFTGTSMVAIIVGNWFVRNKGKALGMAMLGSALGALIYNPLCAALIEQFGFRTAYRLTTAILLAGMLPYLVGYAFRPRDKGLEPLGLESADMPGESGGPAARGAGEADGLTYEQARRTPAFAAVCFIALTLNLCTIGVYTQLQAYLTDVGYAAVLAASLVGLVSLCNGFAKMFFGWLDDKIGTRGNYLVSMGILFCGLACMLAVGRSPLLAYGAAVLFGMGLSCPTIITPMVTMAALGRKDFAGIYSRVAFFTYLGATCGPVVSGLVYDRTGSYAAAIVLYMALLAVSVLLGAGLLRARRTPRTRSGIRPRAAHA